MARSGEGLGAVEAADPVQTVENDTPAPSWQYGVGTVVTALAAAGLRIEALHEWPHANGCRVHPALVPAEGGRWTWPEGTARLPLMVGIVARAPGG